MYRAARHPGVGRRRCRAVRVLRAVQRADRRRVGITRHLCGMRRTRTRRSGRGRSAITTRHLTCVGAVGATGIRLCAWRNPCPVSIAAPVWTALRISTSGVELNRCAVVKWGPASGRCLRLRLARDDPDRPLPHLLQQPPSPQPIERPNPRRNLLHRRPTASRCLTTRPSPRVISPGSDCTERRDHFCHGTVAWLRLCVEKVVHHRDDDGYALHQCHVGGVGQDGQSRCGARLHVAVDLATL